MSQPTFSRRSFVQFATASAAGLALTRQFAAAQPASVKASTDVASLGRARHLFLDDHLLAERKNATFVVNPPERKGLVLYPEKPWERAGVTSYANVFWDEFAKEFRLYYVPIIWKPEVRYCLALATSRDGINWEKPNLGVVERDGSKDNNIVIEDQREGTVLIDRNAPPERRYAYLSTHREGAILFTSPDGIRFERSGAKISSHQSDSQISTFWDDQRRNFVHYLKVVNGEGEKWNAQVKVPEHIRFPQSEPLMRTVARVETATLDATWQEPFLLVMSRDEQDPPGMDLYTNSCHKYGLAPDVYLGFPTPYYHYNPPHRKYLNEPALKLGGKTNDGSLDTQLATSRDGIIWTRHRVPYVPMHREEGLNYWVNMVFPGMLYHPDRIDQFCAGYTFTHGDTGARTRLQGRELGGYLRLSQRIDGFISCDFDYAGGRVVTEPFRFEGSRLVLNLNTSASGEGRVAILDVAGKPIQDFGIDDCHYINGDYLEKTVEWNSGSDVNKLAGRPVRLAFEMRGTKLFSFRVKDV
jgi:hypothetical protein